MQQHRSVGPYELQAAEHRHVDGARSVMLDTFYRDFGYGYRSDWHHDVIDLAGTYLDPDHHALFVATKGDEVVGTTAVRAAAPKSPPHPRFLVERYPEETTAQLFRVYVRPEHRRCGLARALVGLAIEFVTRQPRYQALYLHTDTRIDGAEAFWRSMASPIFDPRDGRDDTYQAVHFEIALPGRLQPHRDEDVEAASPRSAADHGPDQSPTEFDRVAGRSTPPAPPTPGRPPARLPGPR